MIDQIPKNWELVKLGDVVEHCQELERNPKQTGFSRYLKVEHLDADCLKISRWGDISNGDLPPTFYKIFRAGQVLYPTRNPHLRRIAYADFDGICGEKTLTISPTSRIDSKLFPFIFQNSDFINYTTTMMIGSTNPHIRWRDVASYKFLLPPKEEQRRIGEILWQVEESIRKQEYLQIKIQKIKQRLFEKFSYEGIKNSDLKDSPIGKISKHWDVITLYECIRKRDDFSRPPHNKEKYIGLEHFDSGAHLLKGFIDSTNVKSNCSVFNKGELLYSKLRPYLDKAVLANFDGLCSTEVLVLNSNDLTTNEYLLYHFHSRKFIKYNEHHSYGTKMPRTSFDTIGKYQIALPPLEDQKAILKIIKQFDILGDKFNLNLDNLKNLKKYLLNDLLSGEKCLRSD